MNTFEHFVCSSSLWRYLTQRQLLPWLLAGTHLGDHVLEIGAGYGPATPQLRQAVPRVTTLEYDPKPVLQLKSNHNSGPSAVLRADAARFPFADQTFSSALAILVLHHLKSREQQNRMLAEVFRVLRPGGVFLTFEVTDSWIHRLGHIKSTFTPISPGSAFARLTKAGFSRVAVDFRPGGFRVSAARVEEEAVSPDMCEEERPAPAEDRTARNDLALRRSA